MKRKYKINGMSCSACAAHVKKAVENLPGYKAEVSLLTNSMEVLSDSINDELVISSVETAGYKAFIYQNEYLNNQEKKVNFKRIRLIISIVLLVILMYVAMGPMIGIPHFFFLKEKYILVNLYLQLGLTIAILGLNYHYFTSGFSKLFRLKPNMDSLVAIGSLASFVYACVNLVIITMNYNADFDYAKELMHKLFFDSSAMIVTLVSVGKFLEGLSKKSTTKALDLLMEMVPQYASKKVDDHFENVSLDSIEISDIIEVNPYDLIPLDGKVLEGTSNVDESSITGESLLKVKTKGDVVLSGTQNQEGKLVLEVLKNKESSTMNEIIKMVEEASSSKMRLERVVDKVALYFVPVVILLAIITLITWVSCGYNIGFALKMFISVLVISCPCALGLATPLCVMVSTLLASKNHILVKEASVFENLSKIDVVMFDKTGTLTNGKMVVIDSTLSKEGYKILASLEKHSNHPLAAVILENFESDYYEVIEAKTEIGRGISGIVNGVKYYAGSRMYLDMFINKCEDIVHSGTMIYLFTDNEVLGYVTLKDTIKSTSKMTIDLFKKQGIKTIMLTGDNEIVAKEISEKLGLDEYKSNLMPQDKASIVKEYMQKHKVLMVGDGINDSVALQSALVGIAMNQTNIARGSADIILTKNDILDAYNAYYIARKTVKNIYLNLFWALIYNSIMIPLAAGVFYIPFGLELNPMIGALCMSLSSICVCLNALRLRFIKIERRKLDMKFYVRDMMCPKCEAHVKEALSNNAVSDIKINLNDKSVEVSTELSLDEIFAIIKEAGYNPSEK